MPDPENFGRTFVPPTEAEIEALVRRGIEAERDASYQRIVVGVMKATGGKGNPDRIAEIIKRVRGGA